MALLLTLVFKVSPILVKMQKTRLLSISSYHFLDMRSQILKIHSRDHHLIIALTNKVNSIVDEKTISQNSKRWVTFKNPMADLTTSLEVEPRHTRMPLKSCSRTALGILPEKYYIVLVLPYCLQVGIGVDQKDTWSIHLILFLFPCSFIKQIKFYNKRVNGNECSVLVQAGHSLLMTI